MSYLITLFEQHSYLILFLGIFLELMALPISGEFLMSYAGYFVFQGKMNYILALLTVFVAGGAGITVTYWIGRSGGYKLIEKYGEYIHLGPERYTKISIWFEKSGSKLLIFAYFIPGIRHFTGYISGISQMSFRKFIIPAYIGAFFWGVCFISLGRVLGPEWKIFHQAASRYLIIILIVLAVLLAVFLLYRFYEIQIKRFFVHWLNHLLNRLKTIRATELFLIILSVVLIGMSSLMLGMAQDYLYSEFNQFNKIADYTVHSVDYKHWTNVFIIFQSPYVLSSLILITIFRIWKSRKNQLLEYLLLIVSIFGGVPFRELIMEAFTLLRSFGFAGKFHSANFPDLHATLVMIVYGTCLFLLFRHIKNNLFSIFGLLFGLVLFTGLAIENIASTNILPSDIMGGYVYGGVWIFFNFWLFEMLRLILDRYLVNKDTEE